MSEFRDVFGNMDSERNPIPMPKTKPPRNQVIAGAGLIVPLVMN